MLYLAVFPFALFLQAVYSESLYLLLTLAAFVLAERHRFLLAGGAAGLALLTRPTGAALLPALALLAWRERDRARTLAALAVAPLLFAAYPVYLWRAEGDPWAFVHAQRIWSRHLSPAGPLGGIWDGLRAGWAGVEQLASGSQYLAPPPGATILTHPPGQIPQTMGATFNPPATDHPAASNRSRMRSATRFTPSGRNVPHSRSTRASRSARYWGRSC